MKRTLWCLAGLAIWAATAGDAAAAWNNVYQPTLFCRKRDQTTTTNFHLVQSAPVVAIPVVATSAPCYTCQQPPPQPCPQPCSTSYTQRCFYQPVVSYTTETRYEPVTTTQTSYYYEPVTSYRTSYYYDSCSCSYYQQCTPVVSYQLRSKCCPVQSWVARCVQVPVTTYQKACYWEPKTTCCQTTTGALIPIGQAPATPPQVYAAPQQAVPQQQPQFPQQQQQQPFPQNQQPPVIKDSVAPSGPNVGNTSFSNPQSQWQPSAVPQSNRQPQPAQPRVQLDKIVYGPESFVEGQVVRNDNSPRSNASLLFVSADNGKRETVTSNSAGRFQTKLASGNWLVYVQGTSGTPQFYSRFSVPAQQTARITVVN